MAKDTLLDSRVSIKQAEKAVNALYDHASKVAAKEAESELLGSKEQHVWLNVTVKKLSAEHKLKPVKIAIVHPLIDPRTSPICLLTKDPQREYKDLLEKHNIKFISRVIGLEKLKGKFHPYEARRMLLKENGMFLADERIIPLLPKLLGAKWFQAKKQPIPVCLTRKDLKGELERAVNSTYMNQNRGTFTSIKIGSMTQTPVQILANLKSALPEIAKHVYGGWENVQSFGIKTSTSVSLPIWNCSLDDKEGGRWEGLTAEEVEEEDAESVEEEEEEKPKKGKKRGPVEEDDDEEEIAESKPKKKAKSEAKAPKATAKKAGKVAEVESSPAAVVTSSKAKAEKSKAPASSDGTRSSRSKTAAATPTPSKAVVAEVTVSKKKKVTITEPPTPAPVKKSKKVVDEGPKSTVTVSAEEFKQKRASGPGEKKKEKLSKAKAGKSVKDKVLGRKVASS